MAFKDLLNPILGPLLNLNPLLAIIIIAFFVAGMIVLIYRKFTDQDLMKRLKTEIKELQKEMKTLKDKPEEMMKIQKKAMETNTKYMMHSFKPTLFTFIPIILIFGWLNANFAYYPIVAGEEFSITATFQDGVTGSIDISVPDGVTLLTDSRQTILDNQVKWVLKAEANTYTISYDFNNHEFEHQLVITDNKDTRGYAKPDLRPADLGLSKDVGLDRLVISNKKVQPFKSVPLLGSIPWIGNFGWLGTYILFSIGFSIALRRILKVY